jgi:hypothetical protein
MGKVSPLGEILNSLTPKMGFWSFLSPLFLRIRKIARFFHHVPIGTQI